MEGNAGTSKASPPAQASSPGPGHQRSSSASAPETAKTGPDMDLPRHPLPKHETAAPTTPKGDAADSRTSMFRGPGGSPIVERSSPMQHRSYTSSSSAVGDVRREASSMSPSLARQGVDPQQLRMLPPPSPPTQRHQLGHTGMDLPPLSSLTSSLPHRPPSSGGGGMSISSLLGSGPPANDSVSMHSHHHHPSSHHHHHRPARPYTPEYGTPLGAPPPSTSNPLGGSSRSQSTPTTPALGYPDIEASSHGRSSSYGRVPSNAGMLPAPFRDGPSHRSYMSRDPVRDDYFPRQRDILNVEQPSSPSPQHLPDMPKSNSPYSHQKHPGPNPTAPPPPPPAQHHHQSPTQQPQHQPIPQPQQPLSLTQQPIHTSAQQPQPSALSSQPASSHLMSQSSHSQTNRPTTNGSSVPRTSSHHHHHHRPMAQPNPRLPLTPQPRPQPKVIINNSPALDVIAHITSKPFLGRFIYEPGWIIPASVVQDAVGGKFEVLIAQRFLNRDNEGVVRRKLWGSGVYTDDSDVVATSSLSSPKDIAAHFSVLPTLKHYAPSTFNEIRSRGWKIHDGYSIYLDKVEWLDLGSADGVWRGRKRRLDEEYRMGADDEIVGMNRAEFVFKGVNWEAEPFVSNKRNGEGQRVGVLV